MSAPAHQYQLFSPAQSIESALATIFDSQGMDAWKSFDVETKETPRVELQVILGSPVKSVSPMVKQFAASDAQAQPFDSWIFSLLATVITERTKNGIYHVELIGKTRYNLQVFRLKDSLTEAVSPYHTITRIQEVGEGTEVDDDDNLQKTQLTFTGILNIRENAWA